MYSCKDSCNSLRGKAVDRLVEHHDLRLGQKCLSLNISEKLSFMHCGERGHLYAV